MNNDEALKVISILSDISGIKVIAQLVNQPQKFVYLESPNWSVVEFVDADFVAQAFVEHGFQLIEQEVTFRYLDRANVLKNFILP